MSDGRSDPRLRAWRPPLRPRPLPASRPEREEAFITLEWQIAADVAAIVADHRAKGTDPADAIEHYRTWTRQAMERAVDFGVEWVELVRGRP